MFCLATLRERMGAISPAAVLSLVPFGAASGQRAPCSARSSSALDNGGRSGREVRRE
jgi:hypothetical protein